MENKEDEQVFCHDCGADATKDRWDNGDNKIRCGKCSEEKYKKDVPIWRRFVPKTGIFNFNVKS